MYSHLPVLLDKVLEFLAPRAGGVYLDGTLGLGGHSRALLERAGGPVRLLGLDRDAQALEMAGERLAGGAGEIVLRQGLYSRFDEYLDELGWDGLDGALLDIGVSSLQLDAAARGFSFLHDGPLDMRMNPEPGAVSAQDLVNRADVAELRRIIRDFGEEPMAGRIASAIVSARRASPVNSTLQLAGIVDAAYPARWRATARNHPATRTFQALRMAVNNELGELETFLRKIPERLKPGGRVAVLSFHSLEDRLVKRAFRAGAGNCLCPPHAVSCTCGQEAVYRVLTRKPLTATPEELRDNPRAGSAKLRVAERL